MKGTPARRLPYIEATKIGSLDVSRYIIRYRDQLFVALIVPTPGWKHPVRILLYENDGGNPGKGANLEPLEWRRIRDAILLDLGHITEAGVCIGA